MLIDIFLGIAANVASDPILGYLKSSRGSNDLLQRKYAQLLDTLIRKVSENPSNETFTAIGESVRETLAEGGEFADSLKAEIHKVFESSQWIDHMKAALGDELATHVREAVREATATDDEFVQLIGAKLRDVSASIAELRSDHREILDAIDRMGAEPVEGFENLVAVPSPLPPKTYHSFVGRYDQLDLVMSALREPQRKSMVAIIGLGGIGKTALAREAAERCLQEKLFNHIVWASFKTEHFVGEDILKKTGASSYSFYELLSDIGRQCNRPDIAQMPPEQKQITVKYLLATERVLIVMDNLDTVPDSEKLVDALFQILDKSKLLITSRHHVKNEQVFTVDLVGFPEDEGVRFLREDSKERGIEVVAQANRPLLFQIHQVTGGAPLAMKLVVGQMSRQPMETVLSTLKEAAFKGQDYTFYRFVYQYSWEMLDTNARKALVDMSVFPPITGGAVADVQAVSQVESSAFWPAMDQLVLLSLVDKTGLSDQARYALHPLTQYFILSDITKEWADQ
jgi:hypothetical protein